ncbi:MAG: peptidylprolyl isomerase [Wenzhouxiangellaceae bacterium]
MQVKENHVVQIDYTLTNNEGQVLDSSNGKQPLAYIHGHGQIIPGLEQALEGKAAGDKFDVTIPAEQAYGEHRPDLVQQVPASAFAGVEKVEPGMRFQAETDQGPIPVTVTAVTDEAVTVDANHELAGQELNFAVKIEAVRAATETELDHGHVHGADGHQQH